MISAQRSRFLPFLVLLLVAGTALIVPPLPQRASMTLCVRLEFLLSTQVPLE